MPYRAVAQEFGRRGARVAVADIDLDAATAAAELIGNGSIALKCDVLSEESVRQTANAAEAALAGKPAWMPHCATPFQTIKQYSARSSPSRITPPAWNSGLSHLSS